jgi:hypothetical protein
MEPNHPLSDIWETYTDSLDHADANGLLEDEEVQESYLWPTDLRLADWEQEDVKRYVAERMGEMMERMQTQGGLDPNLLAGYLFRSILCGMMWEKERIG